jgi:hypothetical protein
VTNAPSKAVLRLLDAWQQCQRHAHHMSHALSSIEPTLPLTAAALPLLNDEAVQDWDQFVLRFTKLQDTMGARLFPALLDHLQEPFEDRPMLDKLHRLEKLGYLQQVGEWQLLRAIRNRFAHDYPEDDALKAAYLNEAVDAVRVLRSLLARIEPVVAGLLSQSLT